MLKFNKAVLYFLSLLFVLLVACIPTFAETNTTHINAQLLLMSLKRVYLSKDINLISNTEEIIGVNRSLWRYFPTKSSGHTIYFRDFDKYGIDGRNFPYRLVKIKFRSKINDYKINVPYKLYFILKEKQACITPEDTKKIFGDPDGIGVSLISQGMECSTGFRDSLRYFYKSDVAKIQIRYSLENFDVGDYTISKEARERIAHKITTYKNHKDLCAYLISFKYLKR